MVLHSGILNCTFLRDVRGKKKKVELGSIKVYNDSFSFQFICLPLNQRTVNIHSNKSARVLVRSATGRLVLSLVMANSCMPSSSATLACVRLFTSELRRSYGQTCRALRFHVHSPEMYSRCEHTATQRLHTDARLRGNTQRHAKTSK